MDKAEIRAGFWRRSAALGCLFLLLAFAGLETVHSHAAADMARSSSPCVICVSVHANTPAVTAHPQPVVFAVEAVTIPFSAEGKAVTADLTLFIRPPPTV